LPLLISRVVCVGVFAAVLVVLMWAGQWMFVRLPAIRAALPARVKGGKKAPGEASDKNEQKEQSKKNEE
jgi:hypothetical protein